MTPVDISRQFDRNDAAKNDGFKKRGAPLGGSAHEMIIHKDSNKIDISI